MSASKKGVSLNSTHVVESFGSLTSLKTVSHTSTSSELMTLTETWASPSLALISPQTWVSGLQAKFPSPHKSPSPKMRITRRSSIYTKKAEAVQKPKVISTPKSKGIEFKVPTKIASSSAVTRSRNSSAYSKRSKTDGTSLLQIEEAVLISTKGRKALKKKGEHPSKNLPVKKIKSPLSTLLSKKRTMAVLSSEKSPSKPVAERQYKGVNVSLMTSQQGNESASKKSKVSKTSSYKTEVQRKTPKKAVRSVGRKKSSSNSAQSKLSQDTASNSSMSSENDNEEDLITEVQTSELKGKTEAEDSRNKVEYTLRQSQVQITPQSKKKGSSPKKSTQKKITTKSKIELSAEKLEEEVISTPPKSTRKRSVTKSPKRASDKEASKHGEKRFGKTTKSDDSSFTEATSAAITHDASSSVIKSAKSAKGRLPKGKTPAKYNTFDDAEHSPSPKKLKVSRKSPASVRKATTGSSSQAINKSFLIKSSNSGTESMDGSYLALSEVKTNKRKTPSKSTTPAKKASDTAKTAGLSPVFSPRTAVEERIMDILRAAVNITTTPKQDGDQSTVKSSKSVTKSAKHSPKLGQSGSTSSKAIKTKLSTPKNPKVTPKSTSTSFAKVMFTANTPTNAPRAARKRLLSPQSLVKSSVTVNALNPDINLITGMCISRHQLQQYSEHHSEGMVDMHESKTFKQFRHGQLQENQLKECEEKNSNNSSLLLDSEDKFNTNVSTSTYSSRCTIL